MKPSEAKALQPGMVIAIKRFRLPSRGVVESVRVVGPRKVLVTCVGSPWEHTPDNLEMPTPTDESRWAEAEAERQELLAYRAEKALVSKVFGVEPSDRSSDWGRPAKDYHLTLTRAQVQALLLRLQPLDQSGPASPKEPS